MADKTTFKFLNGVLMKHVDQENDSITTFMTTREKFEYVGDGDIDGTQVKFLVDVPTKKAQEVFWVHHTRRLTECSKLLVVFNDQEKINQLAQAAGFTV